MCTGSCDEKPRAARQGGPLKAALAAALALLATGAPARAADSFSTDWAQGAKSQARLIAAGRGLAGFEIALAPGAINYWRDPGDSGLPPTLDFSASENVASVEIKFPAPKRIKEADGGEAFGYDGAVIFPLSVKPRDPAKPVTLALNADFAAPPGRRGFSLRGRDRRRPRRRPAPGSAEGFRRPRGCRRRQLALLRAARGRPAARPFRRAAGGLVAEGGAGFWRRRARLLQAHARRQAEGRSVAHRAQTHADRRRGGGGDDGGDGAVEVGAPRFTRQSPVV